MIPMRITTPAVARARPESTGARMFATREPVLGAGFVVSIAAWSITRPWLPAAGWVPGYVPPRPYLRRPLTDR